MATYDNLPVYKASYDLLLEIFEVKKQFPREYKFTLGERLANEAQDMIINVYRANIRKDKRELLQKARENIEVVRLLFRLLKDMKQISLKRFVGVNEKIEIVSKQLSGWLKSQ